MGSSPNLASNIKGISANLFQFSEKSSESVRFSDDFRGIERVY